jgi:hypothetical protein
MFFGQIIIMTITYEKWLEKQPENKPSAWEVVPLIMFFDYRFYAILMHAAELLTQLYVFKNPCYSTPYLRFV